MRLIRTAFVVFILMATGMLLWKHRSELLGGGIELALESAGLGPAKLSLIEAGPGGLVAEDGRLAEGAITATRLEVRASLADLLARRIESIEVRGLQAALRIDDGGVSVGGRQLGSAGTTEPSADGWRIDRLGLEGSRIDLDLPAAGLPSPLRIELQRANLTVDGAEVQGELAGGRITATGITWRASDIGGHLTASGPDLSAHLKIGRLEDQRKPALLAPLGLGIDLALTGQNLEFTVDAAMPTGGKGKVGLKLDGRHDLATATGTMRVAVGPVTFRRQGLRPADLSPELGPLAAGLTGTIGLTGRASWRRDKLTPDLVLQLTDVGLRPEGVDITGLTGQIRINGLSPPTTPPGQRLDASYTAAGLPPQTLALRFELRPGPVLQVERLEAGLAGGRIIGGPLTIGEAQDLATVVEIEQVDLAEVIRLIGIEGASGTGRISGRLPIRLNADGLRIEDGGLAAEAPGIIRLPPGTLPESVVSARKEMAQAARALEEFRYQSLAMEVDKGAGGEGTILVRLSGANPAVMDGRRFDFNIALESNLDELQDIALRSMAATQELLRRAEGRARP